MAIQYIFSLVYAFALIFQVSLVSQVMVKMAKMVEVVYQAFLDSLVFLDLLALLDLQVTVTHQHATWAWGLLPSPSQTMTIKGQLVTEVFSWTQKQERMLCVLFCIFYTIKCPITYIMFNYKLVIYYWAFFLRSMVYYKRARRLVWTSHWLWLGPIQLSCLCILRSLKAMLFTKIWRAFFL